VHLDGYVLGALHLQDAERAVAVVGHLGVRAVVDDQQVVLTGEGHGLLVELDGGHGARGVVRVVEEHELGGLRHRPGDGVEVGEKAVLGSQRHRERGAATPCGLHLVHRVGRIGDEHHVAGVDVRPDDVNEGFLGAQAALDLVLGADVHTEAPLGETRDGLLVLRNTEAALVVGVGLRVLRGLV